MTDITLKCQICWTSEMEFKQCTFGPYLLTLSCTHNICIHCLLELTDRSLLPIKPTTNSLVEFSLPYCPQCEAKHTPITKQFILKHCKPVLPRVATMIIQERYDNTEFLSLHHKQLQEQQESIDPQQIYNTGSVTEMLNLLWVRDHTQACPNCGLPVLKGDGCTSLICPNCYSSFNWKYVSWNCRPYNQVPFTRVKKHVQQQWWRLLQIPSVLVASLLFLVSFVLLFDVYRHQHASFDWILLGFWFLPLILLYEADLQSSGLFNVSRLYQYLFDLCTSTMVISQVYLFLTDGYEHHNLVWSCRVLNAWAFPLLVTVYAISVFVRSIRIKMRHSVNQFCVVFLLAMILINDQWNTKQRYADYTPNRGMMVGLCVEFAVRTYLDWKL